MSDSGVAADYTPLSTNMEFEDLTLPRDKFSRFRYFFVVHPRFTFSLLLDLTAIGLCTIWFILRGPSAFWAFFSFFAILIITCAGIPLSGAADEDINTDGVTKDTQNSISFLGEVVRFKPGLDVNKWDLIAARSNRVFHQNNNNVTPYFFYDGAKCLSYFKSDYVGPAKTRRANGCDTVRTGLQLIIDQAVKVYDDSLEEYWGRYMAEINDTSEQNDVRNDSDKDQTAS